MKKFYIIQAHKNPEQLKRLVERLNENNTFFFIHIDLKTDILPFKNAISLKNVKFIKDRVNCIWGDYSQVLATLNLIKEVLTHKKPGGGYIIFISGQDYPLKNNTQIDHFLIENKDYDFINFDSKTRAISRRDKHFYRRLSYYKINLSDQREDFVFVPPFCPLSYNLFKYLKAVVRKEISIKELFSKFSKKRNAEFCNNIHYRGSNWWGLRIESANTIYKYYLAHQKCIDDYYQYTFCADEQFFQTLYACTLSLENTKDFLHYVDWSNEDGETPTILKSKHFETLKNLPAGKLFARKFDSEIDKNIFNLIDKEMLL